MSKVTITELISGDIADVADVNATLNSWETNSTGINDENFRVEGLDFRSFAKTFQVFGSAAESDSQDGDIEAVTSTSVVELTNKLQVGGFTVSSTGKIVVRVSIDVKFEGNLGGNRNLLVYIGTKSGSAGVASVIVKTLRTAQSITNQDSYFPITIAHVYDNTVVPDLYFTVMVQKHLAGGDDITVRNGFITAIQYQRSN
jgi:hypothetical protein